jgi:hypothetical protein
MIFIYFRLFLELDLVYKDQYMSFFTNGLLPVLAEGIEPT